ncbi:MAG: ATP-dependent zinc metalloprotease FtsH [Acidobacteriota bacterium]
MARNETGKSTSKKTSNRTPAQRNEIPPPQPNKPELNHRQWTVSLIYVVLMLLALYAIRSSFSGPSAKEVPYSQFMSELHAGHLSSVVVSSTQLTGTLKPSAEGPAKAKASPSGQKAPEANVSGTPATAKPGSGSAGTPAGSGTATTPGASKAASQSAAKTGSAAASPKQGAEQAKGAAATGPSQEAEPRQIVATRIPGIDNQSLLKDLEAQHVKIVGEAQSNSVWLDMLISWLLPLVILFLIFSYAMRRLRQGGGAGPLTLGKNKAKIHDQLSGIRITFDDVAGVEEAKGELVEVVDFLRHPQKYQRLGGRIPKGVLLVGAPGTGKTLLAKAVAGEAEVPFFSISGSEFVEMFVGVGAARVRDLFEQAKEKAPCIIFIDELDAVGKSRAGGRGPMFGNDEREQTLNQLLVEMDGFDASKGIIIMAATNTPEVLDPALLRAGRFDRHVVLDRPDLAGREAILRLHARDIALDSDADLKTIAARTPGMVGADLANIINEAALLAARRGAEEVGIRDLEEAIDRVMLGLEKRSRVMSQEQKERVAYHETGHALVALSVEHSDPVHRVSIIPRSIGALGHMLQLPTQERFLLTQPELEDRLAVMLGGRGAEEIVYSGVVSTGASDDLEKSSETARQMVTRFGMSERLGQLTYGKSQSSRYLSPTLGIEERNYSEKTAVLIDQEVQRIIDETYERVKKILVSRREALEQIATELIDKETLNREELQKILSDFPDGGSKPPPHTGSGKKRPSHTRLESVAN